VSNATNSEISMKSILLAAALALGLTTTPYTQGATMAEAKPTTTSGLKYEDLKAGTGETATAGRMVSVNYTGWLTDGKKFDSSKDRGQPFEFPLHGGRVIKGWDEGVQGMKVGRLHKLTIPANLAYGSPGAGVVHPARRDAGVRSGAAGRALTDVRGQPAGEACGRDEADDGGA
jgi:hypothetical protein